MLNRPGGLEREQRRRGVNGLVLPEVLTVRILVLTVVVLISTVLLVPTVRAAVQQNADLHRVRVELEARQAEADRLQRELDRWNDEAFIEGQARSRLLFAMPGDQVWRSIGGEHLREQTEQAAGARVHTGILGRAGYVAAPWYTLLWESVQAADRYDDED